MPSEFMLRFLLMERTISAGDITESEKRIDQFFDQLDLLRIREDGSFVGPPDFATEVRSYLAILVNDLQRDNANAVGRLMLMNAVLMALLRGKREDPK
jgi:hypothetical protein